MKYNININQKGLEFDNLITIREAAVIDWLHTFAGSANRKINKNKVDGWTWVSCQYLVNDMPLLRIKTRSGGARILTKLEELGYIELKREPRKLFFRPTEKLDELYVASEQQTGASKQQNWCRQATNHNTNTNTISESEASASGDSTSSKKEDERKFIGAVFGLWKKMAATALGIEQKEVEDSLLYVNIKHVYKRENWGYEEFQGLFKHFFADPDMKREKKLAYSLCLSQPYIAKYKLSKKKGAKSNASISGDIKL